MTNEERREKTEAVPSGSPFIFLCLSPWGGLVTHTVARKTVTPSADVPPHARKELWVALNN